MRPKIKICGVTCPEDALLAADLGADFVGINFYPPSPRSVTPGRAVEIAAAVAGRLQVVGVFVNAGRREVEETAAKVGLDLLQFHGDEGPGDLEPFGSRAIKVFRRGEMLPREELAVYGGVWGFLFDVPHPRLYGGSGESWDYSAVAGAATGKPVLVAGGISPGNARRAAAESRSSGLDVCSGVETSPGVKSPELMRELFMEVADGETVPPS